VSTSVLSHPLSVLPPVSMNFGYPSQLPTPPETDADVLVGARHPVDLMNAPGSHISDQDTNPQPSVSVPVRRVSTLAYHNSPLRDPRERLIGRQSRWLIVVIPPASLVQDHGPLGHTLTSGPTQRLSQGILMPLQATVRIHISFANGLLNDVRLDVWPTHRYCP
jgi:hypothetical protein